MATFIMLSRLSPEGMKTLRNNPQRIQEVNREIEGFGARVVQQYALLGHHDFITVLEAPDAETVSRVSVELSSRATASYETLPAIEVDEFVARLRGESGYAQEGGRHQEGERHQEREHARERERTQEERGRSGSTGGPIEGDAELPPREQAREDVQDIKEEIRSEEAPRRRTEEGPPRTEEATPQGRERGEQPESARDDDRSRQPESERDDDRGLIDRANDAVMDSEEELRRREGTKRTGQR